MSATVGAALKKIAVALLSDPKVIKTVLGIVLGIIIIIVLPFASILAIFNGDMNAVMERKASEYDYTRCVVDKIVEVSKSAFETFLRAPINDYDFIDDFNQEEHDYRSNTRPCLLLLGEGHDDGVLINTEGYPYARYSAYIPHARQIAAAHEIEQSHDMEPDENASPVLSM